MITEKEILIKSLEKFDDAITFFKEAKGKYLQAIKEEDFREAIILYKLIEVLKEYSASEECHNRVQERLNVGLHETQH